MNIKTLVKKLENRMVAELPNLTLHGCEVEIKYTSLSKNTIVKIIAFAYPKKADGEVDFANEKERYWLYHESKSGLADALKAFDEKLLGINSISKLNIEDNE